MKLRPFFSYYGAKHRAANLYPAARYGAIIEPFAGSAGYATAHADRNVILGDLDHRIVGVWRYLIRVRESEIMRLPTEFECVDNLLVPQEAKWFLGFWIVKGASYPRRKPSRWMKEKKYAHSIWSPLVRDMVAAQVCRIRHWQVHEQPYDEMPNVAATWFIDPPYEGRVGRHYKHRRIDRVHLAAWCRKRVGQVIACEAQSATWLPFEPLASVPSMATRHGRRRSEEGVWYGGDVRGPDQFRL